jgi:DNA-binding transcriptional ArsR family regulator
MGEINKGFYAIIPANIRYDKEVPPNAKLFYSEITALCNERGYCWANNEYFTELYDTSDRTIRRWLSVLSERGYITVEYQYKAGTKEILKRYIKLAGSVFSLSEEKSDLGEDKNVRTYGQKCPIGEDKNVRENNIIYNNNIYNNSYSHSGPDEPENPPEKKKSDCEKVVDLYSLICTKLPKVVKITENRKKTIKKLLETYTLEQIEQAFKNVNNSDFCTGNNDRGWRADFDFCINSQKLTNALEGKYKNSPANKPGQSSQQEKARPTNRFHNFDGKIGKMAEVDLEELARKKREKFRLSGREVTADER